MLAVTATAVGFAYDAGSGLKELTAAYTVCYVAGCVLAVLAVRASGMFTAVIQPPLILFVTVPGAYFIFHGDTIAGIKDILINCGYPLIERFPLMFFTSATVLVIGAVRWYLSRTGRRGAAPDVDEDEPVRSKSTLAAEETTLLDAVEPAPRRRREPQAERRPRRTPAAAGAAAATDDPPRRPRRPAPSASRSRHARPPEPDLDRDVAEPPPPRPRRRPAPQSGPAPVESSAEPRKRVRAPREERPGSRDRESRRDLPPVDGRNGYERRPRRAERPDPYDAPERHERPERRRRPASHEPYDPYDPYEGRPGNGTNGTHHPVSRVRYRGDDEDARTEHRTRPRRPRPADADSWEYDV